jgi:hypothetical protein
MRLSLYVALLAGLAAVSGCGGSSSTGKDAGTTTSAGGPSTSTTVKAAATAPATDPTFAKAALQLVDAGPGFANYRKATGVEPVGPKSCSVIVPGAVLTTRDHVYSGAMFKKKDSSYFAYSDTYVFRSEDDAKRYTRFRATDAFKQCKQKQDDEAARAATPNSYVELTPVKWSDPTAHIPSMYRELTGTISGGKREAGGFYDRYTVRRGRVVIVVSIDSELAPDAAASQALADLTGVTLRAFDTALATRLADI